jgi:hypothetical protein
MVGSVSLPTQVIRCLLSMIRVPHNLSLCMTPVICFKKNNSFSVLLVGYNCYFSGFRNTSSQISACSAANGRYIISASEDSNVCIWRYSDDSKPSRKKNIVSVTNTHERFHCERVTVAVAWPCTSARMTSRANSSKQDDLERVSGNGHILESEPAKEDDISAVQQQSNNSNHNGDRASATWPEELMTKTKQSPKSDTSLPGEVDQAPSQSAWGLVIVTAGHDGRIRTFQNFGFPSITSI